MSKEKILLIGAGGHSQTCIDVIEQENKYEIAGLVGIKEEVGQNQLGYKILGTDEDLFDLSQSISNALITVGQIKSANLRKKLFNLAGLSDGTYKMVVTDNRKNVLTSKSFTIHTEVKRDIIAMN